MLRERTGGVNEGGAFWPEASVSSCRLQGHGQATGGVGQASGAAADCALNIPLPPALGGLVPESLTITPQLPPALPPTEAA